MDSRSSRTEQREETVEMKEAPGAIASGAFLSLSLLHIDV